METKFYRVGGCVRDNLLGLQSKDIDFTVESPTFDTMRAAILERGGTIFLESPQYFTIRAKVPDLGAADFVLARKDGAYLDGRRPESVEQGTLLDDLARRDFTVNAIAEAEDGTLIDPFGGQQDLTIGAIRCVGGVERLREDALRMLRAMRFSITKRMYLTAPIASFLGNRENAALLDNVSIERIREELKKMFEADSIETLKLLNQYNYIRDSIFNRNLILVPTIVAQ